MFKIIAVTNRKLCRGDFLEQIKYIANSSVDAIILREKDLSPEEYYELARKVVDLVKNTNTECILHSYLEVAKELKVRKIHLPLESALRYYESDAENMSSFQTIGCSIHSISQLNAVETLKRAHTSADFYVTAGHIFETDCKKGLPGRGLDFLRKICDQASLPVYAIGGITPERVKSIRACKADGACLMSWCMNASPVELKQRWKIE